MSYSLSTAEYESKVYGFQHVKDSGWCGDKLLENLLSKTANDADACAALAAGAGKQSFLLGAFFRRGWCIGGTMEVTSDQYAEWATKNGKANPTCPSGWKSSMLFDFYALEPLAE